MSEVRYFTVDTVSPVVTPHSPANSTINTTDRTPDFVFTVTDNLASSLYCVLYMNNGTTHAYGSVTAQNNAQTTITANTSLVNGSYLWWINCSDDSGNQNQSGARNLTIDIDDFTPELTLVSPQNES